MIARSDAAENLQKQAVSHGIFERHEHSNRCAPYRFREIATFCRQLALLILESRA